MLTDAKRLQQVIKNLLSNAFKFTEHGRGDARRSRRRTQRLEPRQREPEPRAERCIAFSVTDTGIGIPPDKQQIIFEAFQQADGTTSRKYGGTGLGLAISREMSRAARRRDPVVSAPGQGSTFTLYLPQTLRAAAARRARQRAGRAPAPRRRGDAARRAGARRAGEPTRGGAASRRRASATTATTSSPATACC